jgi:Family of unknown function (DUF6418)
MISLLAALLGLGLVVFMFRRNRTAFVAGFFILFTITYRIVDVLFLDLFGPTYATELGRYVGGNTATPMFVLACMAFLIPLMIVFRPSAMRRKLGGQIADLPYFMAVRRWALPVLAAMIGIVYLDMLRLGTVPLLVGMDRIEYNLQAGVLHRPLYELSFMPSVILGIMTVLPRLQGGRFDLRYTLLFLSLLVYWILTGNRFSIFYTDVCYFVLPFGTVVAMETYGKLARIARRDAWSALFSSRVVIPIVMALSAVTLTGLVINSYYDVRGYADPLYQVTQRVFVQPVQFWDSTWADVDFDEGPEIRRDVAEFLFVNPIAAKSNTSIQYLMAKEIGFFRTAQLIAIGQQYAGGYPEILFELFSAWLAVPILFLFGTITALLLRMSAIALSRGRLATSVMAVYVYFGFTLIYAGGMLNFLIAGSFAFKIVVLILAAFLEGPMLERLAASGGRAPAAHPAKSFRSVARPRESAP